jgi:hypothetical protein
MTRAQADRLAEGDRVAADRLLTARPTGRRTYDKERRTIRRANAQRPGNVTAERCA